jgi:hypothetical protein
LRLTAMRSIAPCVLERSGKEHASLLLPFFTLSAEV